MVWSDPVVSNSLDATGAMERVGGGAKGSPATAGSLSALVRAFTTGGHPANRFCGRAARGDANP